MTQSSLAVSATEQRLQLEDSKLYNSLRRSNPTNATTPDPNITPLPGSGTVLPGPLPNTVNDSDGIDPTLFSEANAGPEFSSQ